MRSALATVLMVMACGAAAAQSLEVHLTHAEPGGALRAGALYTATPINGWLYFDLAFEPFVRGALRSDRDIYLVGPEGTRFPLPDRRTHRTNREVIRGVFGTIATSDAAGAFPISRHFGVNCASTFPHRGPREVASQRDCQRYSLLRPRVVISLSRGTTVLTELLFKAPAEGWAAGDYTLTIDGPGDSMTHFPVTIGQEPEP